MGKSMAYGSHACMSPSMHACRELVLGIAPQENVTSLPSPHFPPEAVTSLESSGAKLTALTHSVCHSTLCCSPDSRLHTRVLLSTAGSGAGPRVAMGQERFATRPSPGRYRHTAGILPEGQLWADAMTAAQKCAMVHASLCIWL